MRKFGNNCQTILKAIGLTLALIVGFSTDSLCQSAGSVEAKADRILRQMSDYLAGIEQFGVMTENTLEVILRSGEKIQFDNPANLSVMRPNKLRAERTGDIVNQAFYYNGETLTLFMKDKNLYATVEAPPTIESMIDFAREYLDVFAPGGDLVYRNSYAVLMEDVLSGFYVGLSLVDGVKCHHLAFRGNEVDWQIWIEDGERPLPKKFIITSKWMTGAPQFLVLAKNWNVSPKFTEDIFEFTPPKGAEQIDFISLEDHGGYRP